MIKVLVVTNNKTKCKNIVNSMVKIDLDIKVHSIAYTGKEALEIIRNEKIDIILFDNKLPDISIKRFIDNIINMNIIEYTKSIIVISNASKLQILTSNEQEYIFDSIIEPLNYNELIKKVYNFAIKKDKEFIIGKIHKELEKLHFKFSYHGTQYLVDCIYEIYLKYINENKVDINLSKEIYPIIATKYNKEPNTIHSNLKKSINAMYFDCEENYLKEYFKYYDIENPKLKELMFTVVNNIS